MARDTELYKDKVEVSLDGPQIFYLFFGGAVIVGLVFVLGVMVGRRVEARGHVERAHVEASVDPLAALDRLEAGSGLTFQGALRGADTKTPEVDKKIAAMAGDRLPTADSRLRPEQKPEQKPEVKVEKKPEPKVEEKKPEPKAEEKKVEDKKVEDKKVEAKVEEKKAEPKAEDRKAEDKRAEDKKEPKAEEKKKTRYTLQLSSFHDKAEATAFLESVKSAGFSAYVTEGDVDGKQFFRVRLGSYRSMDAANDARAEFEKATKKSALVTKL